MRTGPSWQPRRRAAGETARVDDRRRLQGVDAARGLALLGMMAVHVVPATTGAGSTSTAHLLAAGRSAALFAVLAGVGVALATGGRRPVPGRRRVRWSYALLVRAVAVGTVGLLLAELDTPVAVILAYYALLFLLAVPALGLRPLVAGGLAVAAAVVVPLGSQAVRPHLRDPLRASPTFGDLGATPGHLLETLTITGYYPVLAWSAYLLAGLAVGRLALDRRRTAVGLLVGGAALAAAANVVSWVLLVPLGGHDRIAAVTRLRGRDVADVVAEGRFGTVPTTTWWWLATDAPHSTTPPDLLHTTGTALAVLGLLLLLAQLLSGRWSAVVTPLAAAGSMPLTLYSLHVVVLAVVDDVSPGRSWLAQAVAALVLATAWRRWVGRGPLEALLAAVTRRITAA
jgi:uncharacterized membrane protein